MNTKTRSLSAGLAAIVVAHLVISIVHGTAHQGAHVPLPPWANVFVYGVILAGPLAGLGLMAVVRRIGIALIGLTMSASFVFGFLNHFVIAGSDHVAHIAPEWRLLFTCTAILLAITEVSACLLAVVALRFVEFQRGRLPFVYR